MDSKTSWMSVNGPGVNLLTIEGYGEGKRRIGKVREKERREREREREGEDSQLEFLTRHDVC